MNIMGLEIESDFEIRKIREIDGDVDLFVDIKGTTLNMNVESMPEAIASRIQFCMARGILIRVSQYGKNVCTLHILRSVDIYSAISNFEIDYSNHTLKITDEKTYALLEIKSR